MEDEPLQPTLARVMAVRPTPAEKPAKGFSWGDYEDYTGADEGTTSADGGSNSDVWEQVKSKKKTRAATLGLASSTDSLSRSGSGAQDASEPVTKKQRQNAEKREAAKAEKDAAERERVERLAKHKKELEKSRIAEQFDSSGKKGLSGGMQATVEEGGKLVWE